LSLRQQWHNFIVDPARPGRHLSSIGLAVASETGPRLDDSMLVDFLSRLAEGSQDIALLASVIDLLTAGYDRFCSEELPSLLDSIANEHVGELAVVGPIIRGNTRWDLTAIGRMSGRLLPAQYFTRLPVRDFGLPENVLVRWLIANLENTVAFVEKRLGSRSLPPQLQAIRNCCQQAARHPWFKDVSIASYLDQSMLTAALRQRLPSYRRAATLASRRLGYIDRNQTRRWQHTLELLAVNWLAPLSDDDLLELYALILVIDILEHELGFGPPTEYGLTNAGRSHVAAFRKSQSAVRVYFDQSPIGFLSCASYQMDILASHDGVRPAPRRPDITVVMETLGIRRVVFVEVKKSADVSYLSDSVYKALGYISDFRDLWSSASSYPKVLLLVPENVRPKPTSSIANMEVVISSSLDRATVSACLSEAIPLPADVGVMTTLDHQWQSLS
jgi:hypothetical protein